VRICFGHLARVWSLLLGAPGRNPCSVRGVPGTTCDCDFWARYQAGRVAELRRGRAHAELPDAPPRSEIIDQSPLERYGIIDALVPRVQDLAIAHRRRHVHGEVVPRPSGAPDRARPPGGPRPARLGHHACHPPRGGRGVHVRSQLRSTSKPAIWAAGASAHSLRECGCVRNADDVCPTSRRSRAAISTAQTDKQRSGQTSRQAGVAPACVKRARRALLLHCGLGPAYYPHI